jgi:hypothetical protein
VRTGGAFTQRHFGRDAQDIGFPSPFRAARPKSGALCMEMRIMTSKLATPAVLLLLALGAAACSSGQTEPAYQYGTAGGTVVPPNTAPGNAATTQQQQENSGYFPEADAPLTPPVPPNSPAAPTGR